MKKALLLLLAFSLVFLFGCERKTGDFLSFQSNGFSAEATVKYGGGEYKVFLEKTGNDNIRMTFREPEILSGTSFEKEGDSLFYRVGDLKIPMKTENFKVPFEDISSLFRLSKDDLSKAEPDELNGVKVNKATFGLEKGNVNLYISSDTNLPLYIESELDGQKISVFFNTFELAQNGETAEKSS